MANEFVVKLSGGHTFATCTSDGMVFFKRDDASTVVLDITDLLVIVQEYQEHFGGIPIKFDFSQWRGIYGIPEKG